MSTGGREIRDLARDLKRVGGLGAAGLSRKMRRKLVASAAPMKQAVQRNALSIPAVSGYSTGLRAALAAATRISVSPMASRVAVVRLIVDGKKMPAGQSSLPPYMEGSDGFRAARWRHPVFGPHNSETWVAQASHPFVAPAVLSTAPVVERGVVAAVDETLAELKGL